MTRIDEDNVKTIPPVEKTKSQEEPRVQNTIVGPSHQDEDSADNLNHQSLHERHQEIENNPRVLGNLYSKIARGRM